MPAVNETSPISFDFAVRSKKDGKKSAEPFKLANEVTEPENASGAFANRTASPVDLMSMETFLALMKLGSQQPSEANKPADGVPDPMKVGKANGGPPAPLDGEPGPAQGAPAIPMNV